MRDVKGFGGERAPSVDKLTGVIYEPDLIDGYVKKLKMPRTEDCGLLKSYLVNWLTRGVFRNIS